MKERFIRLIEDVIILIYLAIKTRGHDRIAFSRHAFKTDLEYFYTGDIAIISSELLRKIMSKFQNGYLEQITCLYHQQELKKRLPLTQKYLKQKKFKKYVFGGLDYFEFVIFCPTKDQNSFVDVIFHENYAVPYIEQINTTMFIELSDIGAWNKYRIDQVRVYGPPAERVIKEAQRSNNFKLVLEKSPRITLKNNSLSTSEPISIMLYAYPGTEYLAPINFTTIITRLNELKNNKIFVKFKKRPQKKYLINKYKNVFPIWCNRDANEQVRNCQIGITFNSITFYEMLSSEMLLIIPRFLDAALPNNLMQLGTMEIEGLETVKYAHSFEELIEIINSIDLNQLETDLKKDRAARLRIIENAFYV